MTERKIGKIWKTPNKVEVQMSLSSLYRPRVVDEVSQSPIGCKLSRGIIADASGSAMIDASNVKIICSVHGPRHRHGTKYMVDDDIGTLECEVKYGGPLVGVSDKDMTSLEINLGSLVKSSIESAIKLTSYPKSVISLHIMILESDIVLSGNNCHYNDYNAAVIVASLALADASIEMYDIVSSCTVWYNNKQIIIDPTHQELKSATKNSENGLIRVSYMTSLNEITQIIFEGRLKGDVIAEMTSLGFNACCNIRQLVCNALQMK